MTNFFKRNKQTAQRRKQLYLDAVAIINERGWTTDSFINEAGQVCMIGAIALADGANIVESAGVKLLDFPEQVYLNDALMKDLTKAIWPDSKVDPWARDVYKWNDVVATQEDVIAVLKKAADNL